MNTEEILRGLGIEGASPEQHALLVKAFAGPVARLQAQAEAVRRRKWLIGPTVNGEPSCTCPACGSPGWVPDGTEHRPGCVFLDFPEEERAGIARDREAERIARSAVVGLEGDWGQQLRRLGESMGLAHAEALRVREEG